MHLVGGLVIRMHLMLHVHGLVLGHVHAVTCSSVSNFPRGGGLMTTFDHCPCCCSLSASA